MPTTTTNYALYKPNVNDPVDQDVWGNYLNDNMDLIDSLLAPINDPTFTGIVTISETEGIAGTTTNNDANAGSIGEYLHVDVGSGSAVSLVSGTAKNIATLPLTAGDWEVWGSGIYVPAPGTTLQYCVGAISETSGVIPAAPNGGALVQVVADFIVSQTQVLPTGARRITLPSAANVYLVGLVGYPTGSATAYGSIYARRPR